MKPTELLAKIKDLNVYELQAANSLMKSFVNPKSTTEQKDRSCTALETLLGGVPAPLYAVLPEMLETAWEITTEAMMEAYPSIREKYNKLNG